VRHGLLARYIVLENESEDSFDALSNQQIGLLRPSDGRAFAMAGNTGAAFTKPRCHPSQRTLHNLPLLRTGALPNEPSPISEHIVDPVVPQAGRAALSPCYRNTHRVRYCFRRTAMPPRRTARRSVPNHYILIVFDSCRYDSFQRARPRHMRKLGQVERRWSYASWTSPSHFNLLMGLLPHASPRHVFASDYYTRDFLKYNERLGVRDIEFKSCAR
jgi:hypothetical protein